MGIRGRSLLKDHTLDEIKQVIIDSYGRVKEVADRMHCSKNAIYDIIDVYPELEEVRKKANTRFSKLKIETAEEVMEKLMAMTDTEPAVAGTNARYVLSKLKDSQYRDKDEEVLDKVSKSLAEIAEKIQNDGKE